MTRTCTVCTSPDVTAIDQDLVDGQSQRSVSDAYRRSASAVRRHASNHLSRALVDATEEREDLRRGDLLDRLLRLVQDAEDILGTAKAHGDGRVALGAVREIRECLKVVAGIQDSPDEQELRALVTALGRTLPRYPDAALALAGALLDLGEVETSQVIATAARRAV